MCDSPFTWTETNIKTSSDMWRNGNTALSIALEIGAPSRSSVIGKMNRLGIERPAAVTKANMVKAAKNNGGMRPVIVKAPKPEKSKKQQNTKREFICEVIDMSSTKTLVGLCSGECRWPVGDVAIGCGDEQNFCAKLNNGHSNYCETHHAKSRDRSVRPLDERHYEYFAKRAA